MIFFVGIFALFSNLLRLLLKVVKVTTEHQKLPKMSTSCMKSFFLLPKSQKKASTEGQSFLQELEVSLGSGLYLLVYTKSKTI